LQERRPVRLGSQSSPFEYSVNETGARLRLLLDNAVRKNLAESVLLSGGLDTSIVAATSYRYARLTGITVSLKEAPDLKFARMIAERFVSRHVIVHIDESDVERAIPDVVRVMRTFDPMEVRNDIPILVGLRAAKEAGFESVMTGDGGDELFAGYSFLFNKNIADLEKSLANMWKIMRFSSIPLAKSLGMHAVLPFLDEEFKAFAMRIPAGLKVRKERGQVYGKWILRKAFEELLPEDITWRVKMPIEQGSGTSSLPGYYDSKIPDEEFEARKKACELSDGVRITSKEHLAYYQVYRKMLEIPRGVGKGTKACLGCGARLEENANYCRTCGAYPV